MNNYRPFAGITPAVKIIIIINVLVFLAINMIGQRSDVDIVNILGLHLPQSQYFEIYQYITHMFTQEGLTHLFFNMFAVFMFGRILESVWGTKRFIVQQVYYFPCFPVYCFCLVYATLSVHPDDWPVSRWNDCPVDCYSGFRVCD